MTVLCFSWDLSFSCPQMSVLLDPGASSLQTTDHETSQTYYDECQSLIIISLFLCLCPIGSICLENLAWIARHCFKHVTGITLNLNTPCYRWGGKGSEYWGNSLKFIQTGQANRGFWPSHARPLASSCAVKSKKWSNVQLRSGLQVPWQGPGKPWEGKQSWISLTPLKLSRTEASKWSPGQRLCPFGRKQTHRLAETPAWSLLGRLPSKQSKWELRPVLLLWKTMSVLSKLEVSLFHLPLFWECEVPPPAGPQTEGQGCQPWESSQSSYCMVSISLTHSSVH